MLIILSAQTVNEDIALQFGRLPPSFLPLGNRRLFSMQAEAALGEACFMTLPESFEIAEFDRRAIEEASIAIIRQPPGLRLTQAIGHALRHAAPKGLLRILYGDTVVSMEPKMLTRADLVAIQDTTMNYPWAFVNEEAPAGERFSDEPPSRLDARRVVCGYFTFSDVDLLAAACHEPSIVKALNAYDGSQPFSLGAPERWFDFGHLPLYFQSKRELLVKRVFNHLTYENHLLIKESDEIGKMRAEAHWYENLPFDLHLYTPRYGGRVERDFRAGYALEYLYHPLLSDLATFGELPLLSWLEIISKCFEFVEKCHAIRPAPHAPEASPSFAARFFQDMIVDKTWSRLKRYCEGGVLDFTDQVTVDDIAHPPLGEVVATLIQELRPTQPDDVRFWHGDLFFGNMFYNFTARRVLCIDPRGQLVSGEHSLFGDRRYDLAKFAHSVIGQYDKIVLGRAVLTEAGPLRWYLAVDQRPEQTLIERLFIEFVEVSCGVDTTDLLRMTALLFFSMLPLHHDRPDLQRCFIAMGLRLADRIAGDAP